MLPSAAVSPLSFHHVSRSSTPGIFSLDGPSPPPVTSPLPPRSRSSPPSLDVAMKPACLLAFELDTRPKQSTSVHPPAPKSEPCSAPTHLPPAPRAPPAEVPARDLPSLSHIAHILRLQKYQKRHRQQIQSQLCALQEASARTVRLTSAARSIQRTLAECIRSEDKISFTTLLNAFHEAQ